MAKGAIHRGLNAARQTLLGLVAAGDPAAVRQCIVQFGPLVWSIARRFAPSEAQAEDATQQIFTELWNHAGRYDPDALSEPVFVTMIARRCMIERLRELERMGPDGGRPSLRPVPDSLASSEQHSASERCVEASLASGVLATLDPRQRRVLSLAFGQGMTPAEIADATGSSPAEVRSLSRRALVAVRRRLQAREQQGDAE